MEDLPQDLIISVFHQLDRYSLGQNDRLWKLLVHNESDMEAIKGFESEILTGSKTWKDIYRDLNLFVWNIDRMSADYELTNQNTIHRPDADISNPAAYGKQTLIPSRNYLEFKICELGGWACIGFTNDDSVAIDGGGVFGSNSKTTCAVFHQSDTFIRTSLDDFTLPDPIESGNVIGFHLNFEDDTVTIFKNSNFLSKVKLEGPLKGSNLYPVIGMSQGSVIEFTKRKNPPPVTITEFYLLPANEKIE